ncbi:hypothetical protein ACIPIN_23900 [Pseudomonas sp. NPDC087697]|uniref:hypothetical protein n=1 Tax=Pseudomonas sp. NPDC087697 TaxID=3364447 RepID=UPI0037FB7505
MAIMISNVVAMMDHVFMNFSNARYYIWVCSLVLGSAGFYTVIIVGGIKQVIPLEGSYLRVTCIVIYMVISFLGLRFYVPRLRNVWLGGMMEEKYISLRGSWVGIVIGAVTGTMIFMPQVKRIELLDGAPYLLIVAVVFLVFTLIFAFLSFYAGRSRCRR